MSESQVVENQNTEKPSLSKEDQLEMSMQQMDALNEKLYLNLYKNLYKEMMESNITKKNVLRAIFKALDVGVDSGEAPTLQSETEAKMGGFFAQLLDKRLLILAKNMRELEENEAKEIIEKNKESETQNVE